LDGQTALKALRPRIRSALSSTPEPAGLASRGRPGWEDQTHRESLAAPAGL